MDQVTFEGGQSPSELFSPEKMVYVAAIASVAAVVLLIVLIVLNQKNKESYSGGQMWPSSNLLIADIEADRRFKAAGGR